MKRNRLEVNTENSYWSLLAYEIKMSRNPPKFYRIRYKKGHFPK